jgi:two-component system, NtrC family, sensor histidine kinase KinB
MKPSVRQRIRIGAVIVVAPIFLLALAALPRIWRLGDAVQDVLRENYISIQAGYQMLAALDSLRAAQLENQGEQALPGLRAEFLRWLTIEEQSLTEVGEPETAALIQADSDRLFDQISSGKTGVPYEIEFQQIHAALDRMIRLNEGAMFRDDAKAQRLSTQLMAEFGIGLAVAAAASAILAWGLGSATTRRLDELTVLLREIAQRKGRVRIGTQNLVELDAVAAEFNHMAEQLEYYELLNVERLIYEKAKVESIIDSLEDGVVFIDGEGKVSHINEIACLILSIEGSEALGQSFDDLDNQRPNYMRAKQALKSFGQGETDRRRVELELFMRGRDHTYILKLIPLQKGVDRLGALLILQDITYIRDEDRARTNLVATLAHELRTPLTSLGFACQMLRREEARMAGPQIELVGTIFEDFKRLKRFSDNLLELVRGRIPFIAMQRLELDLAEMARDVVKRLSLQAAERGARLKLTIGDLPKVFGDATKLPWVISNLIANALRYTERGGAVEISVRSKGKDMVRIEVSDSGPGIAPDRAEHIFERFVQYAGKRDDAGSAGLGLAIAKDIVGAHQGRIFVEPRLPRGSTFVVELPAGVPAAEPAMLEHIPEPGGDDFPRAVLSKIS